MPKKIGPWSVGPLGVEFAPIAKALVPKRRKRNRKKGWL